MILMGHCMFHVIYHRDDPNPWIIDLISIAADGKPFAGWLHFIYSKLCTYMHDTNKPVTDQNWNTCVCSQHCGYWCPGAKAPDNQYPQCWLNIHCIEPVSYKNIAHKVNSIRKFNHILKKWPSHLRVKGSTQTKTYITYIITGDHISPMIFPS